jgi:hypothetical protein
MALAIATRGRGRPGQPPREDSDQDQRGENQEYEKEVLAVQTEGFRTNAGWPYPCWASPTNLSAPGRRSNPGPGAIAPRRPCESISARGTSRRFSRSPRSRPKARWRGSARAPRGASRRGFAHRGCRPAAVPARACACPRPASVPGQQRGTQNRLVTLTRAAVAAEQRTGGRSGGHGGRQARQANDGRCDRAVCSHACVSPFVSKGPRRPSFTSSKKFAQLLNPTERSGRRWPRTARVSSREPPCFANRSGLGHASRRASRTARVSSREPPCFANRTGLVTRAAVLRGGSSGSTPAR